MMAAVGAAETLASDLPPTCLLYNSDESFACGPTGLDNRETNFPRCISQSKRKLIFLLSFNLSAVHRLAFGSGA